MIEHSINGVFFQGVQATWIPRSVQNRIDSTIKFSNWPQLDWSIPVMLKTEYVNLKDLEGSDPVSLWTVSFEKREQQARYNTFRMGIVNGTQEGNRVNNVTVTFRVDYTKTDR